MRHQLRWAIAAFVVIVLGFPGHAWAGFRVCNRSKQGIDVAFGYYSENYGWMSEGWWKISPGHCARLISGDLDKRYFYYVYAVGHAGGLWAARKGEQDDGYFCISKHKFTYRNSDYMKNNGVYCESGNAITKQFAKVDTKNFDDFTYNLENGVEPPSAIDRNDEYRHAIDKYSKAIRRDATSASAYRNRAIAYEHLGRISEAISDYRKALLLDPRDTVASEGLKRLGARPF